MPPSPTTPSLRPPLTGLHRRCRRTWWSLLRRARPQSHLLIDYDQGLRLRVRPVDRLAKKVYLNGYSDREHAALLYHYLKPGMTYFDVGANFGQFSLLAARCVGPSGAVHAFEAGSAMFAELQTNTALNQFSNVHANHAAVSDEVGTLAFNLCAPGQECFNSLGDPMRDKQATETVQAVTLDTYCDAHGVETIDLLKIDVEGAEAQVLRGGTGLLGGDRVKAIACEFNDATLRPMGSSTQALRESFEALGWSLFTLGPDLSELTLEPAGPCEGATVNMIAVKDRAAFEAALR